jgi:hypothetical protein
MLQITVPEKEIYDESTNEFITVKECTLQLEHSLISLSKWESKWCKPFIHTPDKTVEETVDYVKCMTITQHVNPLVYQCLTSKNIREINQYIEAPMTATTFSDDRNGKRNREIITSEILYYQMIALNIPFECQKWHLNRLITLIRVCAIKNQPPKKMSKQELVSRNRALNAARKKRLNSKG